MKYLPWLSLLLLLSAGCAPAPETPKISVTDTYRTWLLTQVADLAERVQGLAAAVNSGDRARAQVLYGQARVPLERIDPVLDTLGDLDDRMDAQEGEVSGDSWGGFHKLEKVLWTSEPLKNAEQAALELVADTGRLGVLVNQADLKPSQWTEGVLEVLAEVREKKLSGGTEPYSHTGAGDVTANLEGVRKVWELLGPGVPDRGAAGAVDRALAALGPGVSPEPKKVEALETCWKAALVPTDKASATDIGILKDRLTKTDQALAAGDWGAAREAFDGFAREWLAREALVRSLAPGAYGEIETQAGTVRRALMEPTPGPGALSAVRNAEALLAPLGTPVRFNAWDVGFLLFREGLEALLVLAALLAFLNRTDQNHRKPWVWAGAAGGLGASIAVALGVSVLMTGLAAASAPALVEGWTGLGAVVLMLTVGVWLHQKSRIHDWNIWFRDHMGQAGDNPWALGFLAFLAVLREGGETVVFLWGLAGSLSPADLVLGITGALVVLAVLGVAVIRFSKRLPLQWFFPLATALVYFLAVKILGQSLGSLQAAGLVPATPLGFGTEVEGLGFSPTWETAGPQVVLGLALGGWVAVTLFRQAVVQWGPKETR